MVSNRSIRRDRWRDPKGERTQTWRTFLRNQIKGIWAADLFVVHTIGFQTLYVFFFIRHERRELIQFNVTASPTAAWIWRQAIEATAWGRQPRHLIRDRDNVYGDNFATKLAGIRIADVRPPDRSPLANSVAERVVQTCRQECLDHVIVLNERHLVALLTEFLGYYNLDRPHRSLVANAATQPTIVTWRRCYSRDSRRTSSRIREGCRPMHFCRPTGPDPPRRGNASARHRGPGDISQPVAYAVDAARGKIRNLAGSIYGSP